MIKHDSISGYSFNRECLSIKEQASPKTTPRAMEVRKMSKKMPTPWKKERMWIFSPWNCESVLAGSS